MNKVETRSVVYQWTEETDEYLRRAVENVNRCTDEQLRNVKYWEEVFRLMLPHTPTPGACRRRAAHLKLKTKALLKQQRNIEELIRKQEAEKLAHEREEQSRWAPWRAPVKPAEPPAPEPTPEPAQPMNVYEPEEIDVDDPTPTQVALEFNAAPGVTMAEMIVKMQEVVKKASLNGRQINSWFIPNFTRARDRCSAWREESIKRANVYENRLAAQEAVTRMLVTVLDEIKKQLEVKDSTGAMKEG